MTSLLLKAEQFFNRFSDWVGALSAILLLLLVSNVFYDVVMRYLFNDVSIGMQELEWHLYSMIFLFGVAYALKTDGHVRVDVIYERLSPKKRAVIDILGTVLLLWPFCFLVADYAIAFAYEAYDIGEKSGDPGGLPYRWVIKGMIALSFACVLISSIGFLLHAVNQYLGLDRARDHAPFKT
ncbi:MAG: TRAP transporter small permease subunit [Chromatiaceae bacterium]|jgi:TRAP-type mannitol/chloroaromatic compound transport system permease small subunit|nr:TRAP transporter small permease subunit [Chromatiaceae bacterium]